MPVIAWKYIYIDCKQDTFANTMLVYFHLYIFHMFYLFQKKRFPVLVTSICCKNLLASKEKYHSPILSRFQTGSKEC